MVCTDVSERGEAGDVVTGPGGEHEADRWDEAWGEAASAQDDVNERPSTSNLSTTTTTTRN